MRNLVWTPDSGLDSGLFFIYVLYGGGGLISTSDFNLFMLVRCWKCQNWNILNLLALQIWWNSFKMCRILKCKKISSLTLYWRGTIPPSFSRGKKGDVRAEQLEWLWGNMSVKKKKYKVGSLYNLAKIGREKKESCWNQFPRYTEHI